MQVEYEPGSGRRSGGDFGGGNKRRDCNLFFILDEHVALKSNTFAGQGEGGVFDVNGIGVFAFARGRTDVDVAGEESVRLAGQADAVGVARLGLGGDIKVATHLENDVVGLVILGSVGGMDAVGVAGIARGLDVQVVERARGRTVSAAAGRVVEVVGGPNAVYKTGIGCHVDRDVALKLTLAAFELDARERCGAGVVCAAFFCADLTGVLAGGAALDVESRTCRGRQGASSPSASLY